MMAALTRRVSGNKLQRSGGRMRIEQNLEMTYQGESPWRLYSLDTLRREH